MKPIDFPEKNVVIAKDQPQYNPLPAFVKEDGSVITCWELSMAELAELQLNGRLYLRIMTFGEPLQPVFLTTKKSEALSEMPIKNPNESQTETQIKPNPFENVDFQEAIKYIAWFYSFPLIDLVVCADNVLKNGRMCMDDFYFLQNKGIILGEDFRDQVFTGNITVEKFATFIIEKGLSLSKENGNEDKTQN